MPSPKELPGNEIVQTIEAGLTVCCLRLTECRFPNIKLVIVAIRLCPALFVVNVGNPPLLFPNAPMESNAISPFAPATVIELEDGRLKFTLAAFVKAWSDSHF